MNRHLPAAYALGAVDLLLGSPLAVGAWQLTGIILRGRRTQLDDILAASALAFAGAAMIVAGVTTLLHRHLPYAVIRIVRWAALASALWMILAGAGMILEGRARGGDWAGITILGGWISAAVGVLLFLLNYFGLRYLRRLRG